jgi:gliding motility-associated-like protein
VIITDSFGCKAIDSVSIYIIPEEIVLVPTGFSPNGDGVNDMLNVTLSPNLTLQEFRIYNRWGEEVFNYPKDNRGKSWDGMYRERVQPISTYVWVVVAKNKVSGNVVNYNGNVTLLR